MEKEKLTIDDIIGHCNRHTERTEKHMKRETLEEIPIEESTFIKEYWEHRQVAEYLEELKKYREMEEQGLLLKLPVAVGDTIYVICECESIPEQLDGALWDVNGGPGTATGYYCPYEDSCPHECEECDDLFDCDKFKNKQAVFEDEVMTIWIGEDGVFIIASNCSVTSHLGEFIFLTKAEAEEKLGNIQKGGNE